MKIQFWQVEGSSATIIESWPGAEFVPGMTDIVTLKEKFYKVFSVHWAHQLLVNVAVKPYIPEIVVPPENQHDN